MVCATHSGRRVRPFYFFFFTVATATAGAFLIRIGHWPRRKGTDPFCNRCNYVLLGIDSDRCPECGQFLSPRTILRGQRIRRGELTFIGGFLLALGIAIAIASTSDWIRRMG